MRAPHSTSIERLVRALARAIGDHGRPNSFGCEELREIYLGPPRLMAGYLGTHRYPEVARAWRESGLDRTHGPCPRFERGGRWRA